MGAVMAGLPSSLVRVLVDSLDAFGVNGDAGHKAGNKNQKQDTNSPIMQLGLRL